MKKIKFNVIDIIIILVIIAVIALCGWLYVNKSQSSLNTIKRNVETITFDIEIVDVDQNYIDNLSKCINSETVFGAAKVDKGILKNVKAEKYEVITADIEKGEYKLTEHSDKKKAIVTIEAALQNLSSGYKGEETYIRVGSAMNFACPGAVGNGFVVGMSPVNE